MALSRKHWLIVFVVGVVAGIAGYAFVVVLFESAEYAVTASIVLFAVSASASYGQYQKGAACQLYDRTGGVCKLGIRAVHDKAEGTIRDCLSDIGDDEIYRWLGFSGVNVVSLTRGEEIIRHNARGTRRYEFFTLDPKAGRVMRRQASWEGRDPETIKLNVRSASDFLASYASSGLNVRNPTHYSTPTFRIIMVGARRIHVAFYPPARGDTAQCGIDSCEIELINTGTDMCIFPWFQWFYSRNLEYADRHRLDRKILKAKFENPTANTQAICCAVGAQVSRVTVEDVRRTFLEYQIETD